MSNHLEPGPLRDVLGLVATASRGGDTLTTHDLSARTGVPFQVMRDRLDGLRELGLLEAEVIGGVPAYTITTKGQRVLG